MANTTDQEFLDEINAFNAEAIAIAAEIKALEPLGELIEQHWQKVKTLLEYGPRYDALQQRIRKHEQKGAGIEAATAPVVDYHKIAASLRQCDLMTPAVTGREQSIVDTFNEMPDGMAKSAFYDEHRETLIKFANKTIKAN